MSKKLSVCQAGETVVVSEVIDSDFKSRILDMGLYVGKQIQILYFAPLGGPLAVKVGDYVLSLRRAEAANVLVNSNPD